MLNAVRRYRYASDRESMRVAATEVIDSDPASNFAGEARVALAEADAHAGP